jgi:ABC-type nitrate/sulfonate/bicarbonate transport system permease component
MLWPVAGALALLGLWWLGAVLAGGHPAKIPTPVTVARGLAADRGLYAQNVPPTLISAAKGYLLGNGSAVILGCLLAALPGPLRRPALGVVVVFYNIPVIALAPLLQVLLTGDGPKIATAALWVFFPTLLGTMTGLSAADPAALDVVHGAGGGPLAALLRVRLYYAVPSIFAALAITVPYAVIGTMVGEFLGGTDHGLGVVLVQGLQNLDSQRVWGAGLVVAAISGLGLLAAGQLSRRLFPWGAGRSAGAGQGHDAARSRGAWRSRPRAAAVALAQCAAGLAVVLAVWAGGIKILRLQPFVAREPIDVWRYVVSGPGAGSHLAALGSELAATLRLSLLGTGIGLAAGTLTALLVARSRLARNVLMPLVLAVNAVPYLALVPILAVGVGRGTALELTLASLIAILPTVINLRAGLSAVPREQRDLMRVYGGGPVRGLRHVELPNLLPALFVSLRLAAPYALYAVLFAEFLATGTGIGGVMVTDAVDGQYDAAWSAAVLVTVTSAALYLAVERLERAVLRRFAPERNT